MYSTCIFFQSRTEVQGFSTWLQSEGIPMAPERWSCIFLAWSVGLMNMLVQEFVLYSILRGFVNLCQIFEWWHLLNLSFLNIFALKIIQHCHQTLRGIKIPSYETLGPKLWIPWVMKGRSALDAALRAVYAACAAHAVAWVPGMRAEQQKQLQFLHSNFFGRGWRQGEDQNYDFFSKSRGC